MAKIDKNSPAANKHHGTFEEDPPRQDPDAGEGPGEGHNITARYKSLDEAIEEWCDKQDEEDDLIDKYIAELRKQKNRIPQRIKTDFEIPVEAFNARARLRRIERRSGADEVVLAVNELFKATPVGKNIDFVVLAERVAKLREEKAAAKSKVQDAPEQAL